MSSGLSIDIELIDNKTVLRLNGRLDAASAPILEDKIKELMNKNQKQLVIDFTGLDYLSSAGMRLLLAYTKKIKSMDGSLNCCCINEEVMEIIKMAGFEKILRIFNTEKSAIEAK
ncbi:MAG: STAS domain-containing protein [Simkaniaceae bacterium]